MIVEFAIIISEMCPGAVAEAQGIAAEFALEMAALLWDLLHLYESGFFLTLKSLAMMTGNLLLPSKNAYSRWGRGDKGSLFRIASRRRMSFSGSHSASSIPDLYEVSESSASISSRMKSLPSNGVRVGEVVISSPCTSIKALAVLKNGLPKINGTLGSAS
ncbi:hypothetical protein Tco_0526436 [Tanacetum coccineum]